MVYNNALATSKLKSSLESYRRQPIIVSHSFETSMSSVNSWNAYDKAAKNKFERNDDDGPQTEKVHLQPKSLAKNYLHVLTQQKIVKARGREDAANDLSIVARISKTIVRNTLVNSLFE